MRFSRLRKYKTKHRLFWFISKAVAVFYLLLYTGLYLTSDTGAVFTSEKTIETEIQSGYWVSNLEFINKEDQIIACEEGKQVKTEIKNVGPAEMKEEVEYVVYFSQEGIPEQNNGVEIKKGDISRLEKGESHAIEFTLTDAGFYQVKLNNHYGELWSEVIEYCQEDTTEEKDKVQSETQKETSDVKTETSSTENDESIEDSDKETVDTKIESIPNENVTEDTVSDQETTKEKTETKDTPQVEESAQDPQPQIQKQVKKEMEEKAPENSEILKKKEVIVPESKKSIPKKEENIKENTNEEDETK